MVVHKLDEELVKVDNATEGQRTDEQRRDCKVNAHPQTNGNLERFHPEIDSA